MDVSLDFTTNDKEIKVLEFVAPTDKIINIIVEINENVNIDVNTYGGVLTAEPDDIDKDSKKKTKVYIFNLDEQENTIKNSKKIELLFWSGKKKRILSLIQ